VQYEGGYSTELQPAEIFGGGQNHCNWLLYLYPIPVVPKVGVNYTLGVICDSSQGNAENYVTENDINASIIFKFFCEVAVHG